MTIIARPNQIARLDHYLVVDPSSSLTIDIIKNLTGANDVMDVIAYCGFSKSKRKDYGMLAQAFGICCQTLGKVKVPEIRLYLLEGLPKSSALLVSGQSHEIFAHTRWTKKDREWFKKCAFVAWEFDLFRKELNKIANNKSVMEALMPKSKRKRFCLPKLPQDLIRDLEVHGQLEFDNCLTELHRLLRQTW
jgi:hypothetical protein